MQVDRPVVVAGSDTVVQWHEAVALVHAVADALADRRLQWVPDLTELALDRDGTVGARPGARAASYGGSPAENARELRRLLGQLLDPAAPAELRSLATGTGGRAAGTPAEFADALAFFERPSRRKDLEALAARLRQAQEQRELETELERLTHKARTEEDQPTRTPVPAPSVPESRSMRKLIPLAAVAVLLALVVVAIVALVAGDGGNDLLPSSTGASGGLISKLRAVARSTLASSGPEAPTADVPEKADKPAAREHSRVRQRASGASAEPDPGREPRRRAPVEIVRATAPEVVEVFVSPEAGGGLPRTSPTVYDGRNADVVPATLLRPRLPEVAHAGVPAGQLGRLEIIIAEDGHVEQVRLLSTTIHRRYYDTMILAAVKAWVFRPASRGGQPVRYRMQIPLT